MRTIVRFHKELFSFLTVLGLVLTVVQPALAQGGPSGESGAGVDLSLATVRQLSADIGDSRFSAWRHQLNADKNILQSRKVIMNLGVSLAASDYAFSGPPSDPWSDPFQKVREVGADMSFLLPTRGHRVYFLAGTMNWSWEDGAPMSDSLVHGLIASASWTKGPDRRLGFGAAAFRGLEETKIFPYVAVSWKLSDNLSLGNPLPVGPAGPAGLELVYEAPGAWQFGTGVAYRSFRFRLDDEGLAPGGIGEVKGLPAWVRASLYTDRKIKVDLYTGVILAGEAIIEDREGRKVESSHYDATPLAAVSVSLPL